MISFESTIIAIKEQISGYLNEGELVILNLKDSIYYGLNPTGARVWELIQEPQQVSHLQEILLDEFEVDPEVCSHELFDLLNHLEERGLITIQ